MPVSKTRMSQIVKEEVAHVKHLLKHRNRADIVLNEQFSTIAFNAADAIYDRLNPNGPAYGLGVQGKAAYATARSMLGATPAGAQNVASQGASFFSDTLKDTWATAKMDMLDWGLTASALTASMSIVGKPISVALDAVSATANIAKFVNSGYADIGASIGAVLDLCSFIVGAVGESSKAFLKLIQKGAEMPEKLITWVASSLINLFGAKAVSMLGWFVKAESAVWMKQSFETFAKLHAAEGIEAMTQKYIKVFVKEKCVGLGLDVSSVAASATAGVGKAGIAASQNVTKTIEVGVANFVKIANAIIQDAFIIMARDLLKSAVGVVAR
jgi:hypothetical protein